MNASFDPLQLVNTYGMFGSVTLSRDEVIVEGTNDPAGDEARWLAYEFKAKPGDPMRRPPQFAPYHLRLDWLMWFAAMGPYQGSPWFVNLTAKLLQGDRELLGNGIRIRVDEDRHRPVIAGQIEPQDQVAGMGCDPDPHGVGQFESAHPLPVLLRHKDAHIPLQMLLLGRVSEARAQHLLYGQYRTELATETAPSGALDYNNKPVVEGSPVALLTIPALGISDVVVDGTASGDLLNGPGHLRTTPLPGNIGRRQCEAKGSRRRMALWPQ